MDNKVFDKYIEAAQLFRTNKKEEELLRLDLHFPWEIKILSARYEFRLQEGVLVFINKGIELETHITYPFLPQVIVFFRGEKRVNFWYKLEANEKNQIVLLTNDKEEEVPEYLLSRKAKIIREAILNQVNFEKFAEEFKKSVINYFIL